MMTYTEAIHYLYQMQFHGIRPGLARMAALLAHFNHPERSFKSVHIAGTNGKGSTASMTAAVLQQAGYRVGLYTSPHLLDFSERIRINHVPIPHKETMRLTAGLKNKLEATSPHLANKVTFFEFTTALAFLYFAEQAVDVAVVEVGLGGRFDATNVITPLVSAITNIDVDHTAYLGTTISEIAREKAGIIKEGVPVVSTASQPEVISIIEETAQSKKAPLAPVGRVILPSQPSVKHTKTLLTAMKVHYFGQQEYRIELPLLGKHQVNNTVTAMGILESLQSQGLHISEADIIEGIKKARIEGRLEVIQEDPLILLDGAHNAAGARALGAFLSDLDPDTLENESNTHTLEKGSSTRHMGKHWLISGIMRDKQISEMMSPLLNWTDEFVFTHPDIERAADAAHIGSITEHLLNQQPGRRPLITLKNEVSDAVSYVKSQMNPQDVLVITGSFYTVGEAKGALTETPPSLIRG